MCELGLDLAFRDARDELDPQERARWERHLDACPSCQAHAGHARAVRSLAAAARSDVPAVDWRRVDAGLRAATTRPATSPLWWLVPAGALAAILAMILWPRAVHQVGSPNADSPAGAAVSAEGAPTHEVLADGSTLTAPSTARMQVVANARDAVVVRLIEGELTADVSKRAERRAFVVQVGDAEIRVLGTRFSVRVAAEGALVSVSRGVIQVTDAAGVVAVLRAGAQQMVATRAQATPPETAQGSAAGAAPTGAQRVAAAEPEATPAGPPRDGVDTTAPEAVADGPTGALPTGAGDPGVGPATGLAGTAAQRPDAEHHADREDEDTPPSGVAARKGGTDKGRSRPAVAQRSHATDPLSGAPPPPEQGIAAPAPEVAIVTGVGDTRVEMSPADGSPSPRVPRAEVTRMAKAARDGQCGQVLPELKRFVSTQRRHPNIADVTYLLGYCQIALGNREAGLRTWKRYERMDRDGPWLRSVGDWTDPSPPDPSHIR
ncbi:MAG: hypothetical protein AMXMBFR64_43380 [Myxococcales bacterium]